jgi:hypothetical protein
MRKLYDRLTEGNHHPGPASRRDDTIRSGELAGKIEQARPARVLSFRSPLSCGQNRRSTHSRAP